MESIKRGKERAITNMRVPIRGHLERSQRSTNDSFIWDVMVII